MRNRGAQFRVRFAVDGDGKIVSTFEAVHAGASKARQPVEGLAAEVVQLSDRLDKGAAATRQYAQDQAVLDAAMKQGLITAREHTRLMDKAYAQTPDGEKWTKFGERIGRSMLWAGGAVATATALVVRNTMAWENQLAQLEAAHASTGNAVGMTREQLVGLAEELSRVSTFGRNEIVEAETRLLSYSGIVGTNFPRAMQAVIDQSARLGISVAQSAETIGRALESPAKAAAALSDQGFGAAFTEEVRATIDALVEAGREADAQIMILEILEESYAGAAQAARDTFGGAVITLKNRLADLLTGRDGSLDGATTAVNDLIDALNDPEVQQGIGDMVDGIFSIMTMLAQATPHIATFSSHISGMARQFGIDAAFMVEAFAAVNDMRRQVFTMGMADGTMGDASGRLARAFSTREEMLAEERGERWSRENLARKQADYARFRAGVQFVDYDGPTLGMVTTTPKPESGAPTGSPDGNSGRRDASRKAIDEEDKALERLQVRMQSYLDRLTQANEMEAARAENGGKNLERVRAEYEIQASGLDELNPKMAEAIRLEADLRDRQREKADIMADGERTIAANRTALDRLTQALAKYDEQLAANAISQADHAAAVAAARGEYEASEERIRRANQSMTEAMLEDWANLGENMDYAFARSLDSISQALTDMVVKGETDFRRLADTIIESFTRVLMDKAIADLLKGLGEGMSGMGGVWGWIGSALAGSRATGGGVRGGALYEITEHKRPEVLRQGNDTFLIPGRDGMVLPALPMAAGSAAPVGGAGGLPQIAVEVHHRGGELEVESAQASQRQDGTMLLRLQTSATQRAFANGDMDGIMSSFYGLQRRGRPSG